MSDVGGYWPSGEEQRANAGSLYCSGGQKRKMNNYSTWWVGWTVTGRAWLTRTPVCSTRHHRCAGTGHVRAVRDEKERQASCVLPQEAKQARGTVALDREDSTRSIGGVGLDRRLGLLSPQPLPLHYVLSRRVRGRE